MEENYLLNYDYSNPDVIIKKGKDIFLYDTNDNKYYDTRFGSGTLILGHTDSELIKLVKNEIDNGSIYSIASPPLLEYSKTLKKILPWFSKFITCSSGTESIMRAFRIGRSYTNKKKIVLFTGFWHGGYDGVLLNNSLIKKETKSSGILDKIFEDVIIVENNDSCFKILEQNKNDIAMVLIEPMQHLLPKDNIELLKKLRDFTKHNNILLCFDEIVSGFRLSPGGAQQLFDIYADLSCYGKICGGGFPMGVVAVSKEIEKHILSVNPKIFLGGTFSGNPISSIAGNFVLNKLYDLDYEKINILTKTLCTTVNKYSLKENIPIRIYYFGSVYRFIFTDKKVSIMKERIKEELNSDLQDKFFKLLKHNGVIVGYNPTCFMCFKHTKEDIEILSEKICKTINEFKKLL